ncbi:tetratricopeptide repeat protein [Deinococcus cellulosilyticus]|uniref:Ancillary SecYEG translocon subunit/Cell division coordinator CpoB TPR domain-containing protein n=1 Tax=Deinococcus cellulosilyticus (strain DSM 18568 / NBRC 106333 / KACC 11606 / 5516J-15) TaxID=1223518 RepID=A0A511NBI3_DEIC1|nr:tetratricopeptide repeat protein [Deinococcus cellulosilyticus]GEM49967.1 hypothetical protein DC3_56020 [Deinococcus cellulosilyticus NBRC 106333 = KACC 11606]
MRFAGMVLWGILLLGMAQSQGLNGIRDLIENGDLGTARTRLQSVLNSEPATARILMARVLYLQGDPTQALSQLNKVPLAQWTAEAFWVRGLAQAELGKAAEALSNLKSAGYLGNNYQYAMDWGATAWRFGRLEVAAEAFAFAEALDASEPWPFLNLGMVLFSQKKPQQALQHLQQGLGALERLGQPLNHPAYPELYYWMGQCHQSLGDLGRAREFYRQAITVDPDYTAASSALAELRR